MGNSATGHNRAIPIQERRGLEELEGIIARGLGTFIDVGKALLEIQTRRLYRQSGYRSFAVYVSERWDLSETHAYRQIEAAKVMEILSPIEAVPLPANEAQARELVPLAGDPEAVRALWTEIESTGQRVTARTIRARVAAEIGRGAATPRPNSRIAIRPVRHVVIAYAATTRRNSALPLRPPTTVGSNRRARKPRLDGWLPSS